MAKQSNSFRVGRVRGDRRGKVWYLTYYDQGQRHRPRIGSDLDEARRHAAEINSQLENGAPVSSSFQSIKIAELQERWLDHHETVARSSLKTIARYRSATNHLITFVNGSRVPGSTGQFRVEHAEQFVKHLRTIHVSPNGHPNSEKRPLRDRGLRYVLEVCRSMFYFASQRRHLPPYADNPFTALQIDKIPTEDSKPIELFDAEQERLFLLAADDWQFPIFVTLMLTGLRPGELSHLLWPDDIHEELRAIAIRNRPQLGWQVKTRRERMIPLHPVLYRVIASSTLNRQSGTLFQRRRFTMSQQPTLAGSSVDSLEKELQSRVNLREAELEKQISRVERQHVCRTIWRDVGLIKSDYIRTSFIRICKKSGLKRFTSPKMLRHLFATTLQEGRVDPLIRNELMGHSTNATSRSNPLGMTATYTHTRPATMREQLERALKERPAIAIAEAWLANR
ncbi:tyrosine-type recombinase/integrase [Thalassoglobus sp.]|uniref:tyrosine-type recombinase/integrase n=1 Tax=Thalassoglobus sp. TaxID=2795869 RepID=UPI003AA8FA6C